MLRLRDRKATAGATTRFPWYAPAPLEPGTTPELVFRPPAGPIPRQLERIRDDISVEAIDDDRRTLTASDPIGGSYRGVQGPAGVAWLVSPTDGAFPVRVVAIANDAQGDRTQVVLATPLPRPVALGEGAVLQFALWRATVTVGDVAGEARRSIPWTVSYVARAGDDLDPDPQREEGLLHVVRQIFGTGLTHERLVARRPDLAARVAAGSEGYEVQIADAENHLVQWLRRDLASRGLYEDDVNGADLERVHYLLALSMVLERDEPEASAEQRRLALLEYGDVVKRIWADANRDGVVDAGEAEAQISGPPRRGFEAARTPYASSGRPFGRGMSH